MYIHAHAYTNKCKIQVKNYDVLLFPSNHYAVGHSKIQQFKTIAMLSKLEML